MAQTEESLDSLRSQLRGVVSDPSHEYAPLFGIMDYLEEMKVDTVCTDPTWNIPAPLTMFDVQAIRSGGRPAELAQEFGVTEEQIDAVLTGELAPFAGGVVRTPGSRTVRRAPLQWLKAVATLAEVLLPAFEYEVYLGLHGLTRASLSKILNNSRGGEHAPIDFNTYAQLQRYRNFLCPSKGSKSSRARTNWLTPPKGVRRRISPASAQGPGRSRVGSAYRPPTAEALDRAGRNLDSLSDSGHGQRGVFEHVEGAGRRVPQFLRKG